MVQVRQLKTAEDVHDANLQNKCPICGKDFQLGDTVVEIESEPIYVPEYEEEIKVYILFHKQCFDEII